MKKLNRNWAFALVAVAVLILACGPTVSAYLADGFTTRNYTKTPADAISPAAPVEMLPYLHAYNGATWDRLRTPTVFKTVTLTAATAETTIWTPTTGKKFRLMGFTLTPGAGSTLTFKDNTAGTTIFTARAATDTPITVNLGNGILSGAVNRLLTVTRGTSATLDGVVWGTEE